ncbi:MAG: TonB-dependent receptor [Brumimicrobium sp.]
MHKSRWITLVVILFSLTLKAQIVQNVKGAVVDSESKYPLVGAKLQLVSLDSSATFRQMTDMDGTFAISDVPIGKYSLTVSYALYSNQTVTVVVNSGKESVVNIELQEDIRTTDEIEIIGRKRGEVINEMATVSSQQFSVEETDRYPGSRGDPARMASNFAGVQGADDSRNDIVIRGNSPIGLLWKVEGIDIPNPNHFAVSGSTGGPVSILNNKILDNSDFFMSAFPADYGNSISGVFDLRLRNGNSSKHEVTGQFGFLGTEVMAEGPLNSESKASYLVMGRYSTLSMFQAMGISIGTDAVPVYGDGAFKLSFPLKKGGNLSFFGIGGASNIEIKISDQTTFKEEAFGEGDRDQYFSTAMGVVGMTYKKPLNKKTFFKTTVAGTYDRQRSHHDYLVRNLDTTMNNGQEEVLIRTDSIYPLMGYQFQTYKTAIFSSLNHKINKQHILRVGINLDGYYLNNIDTSLNVDHDDFFTRHDYTGYAALIQPFIQYKWKVNKNMDFTAGLHSQYFSMSNSWSYAEPRMGWELRLKNNQKLSAGAGLHSQMQPLYQYTYQTYDDAGNARLMNKGMDFTKSIHTAAGYEKQFKKSLNLKTEIYYQHLYNIPIDQYPSSFSLINQGSGFQRFFPDELVNEGTGTNYGIELTIQKFFDRSFFFLVSGSLFESKYVGSDGIERNTDFNGNYAVNFLAGKEFKINEKNTISAGFKVTAAGGRRYGYVNVPATQENNELVFKDSLFNTRQFRDYFRVDFKLTYKLNTSFLTHEIGLDLVNILNTKNILALSYAPDLANPDAEPIAERYQLGFLPIFYYRVDFSISKKRNDKTRER